MIDDARAFGPRSRLVQATGFRHRMMYLEMNFPGATAEPWLAEPALDRLRHAQSLLPEGTELLIWDAYRSPAAQRHLYEVTLAQLIQTNGWTHEQALEGIKGYVANPDGVFPHGTGGAVDLTLWRDGQVLDLGTDFDDFTARAASDWFRQNPPQNPQDQQATENRELLRSVMELAGFVGLSSEWWHYEWGTVRWGRVTQQDPVLVNTLALPAVGS